MTDKIIVRQLATRTVTVKLPGPVGPAGPAGVGRLTGRVRPNRLTGGHG